MYQPFTFRTPKAGELGTYQAQHSAAPCVVVADHLKKEKLDIIGILVSCTDDGDNRYFYTNLTHRVSRMKIFENHILLTIAKYEEIPYQYYGNPDNNNSDTFYDKKRNYPNTEEHEFDDVPQVGASLWYPFYRYNFPPHGHDCGAKFLPPKPGDKLQANGKTYVVVDFQYNQTPKYPIVLLEETTPVKY